MSRVMLVLLLGSAAGCATVRPSNRALLNVNGGMVQIFDSDKATRFGIEYRFPFTGPWRLSPTIGAAASENEAAFFYADLRREFFVRPYLVLSPRAGLGAFDSSPALDLGQTLEFRTGGEVELVFQNGHRIGLSFFHLSNGGISDRNPGTEVVVASWSVPVGAMR